MRLATGSAHTFFSHQSLSVEEGWLSPPWSSLGLVLVGLPGLGRLVGLHGLGDLHGLHGAGTRLLHGFMAFMALLASGSSGCSGTLGTV